MTARELFRRYADERKTMPLPGYRLDAIEGLTRHTPVAPDIDGIVMFSELTESAIDSAIQEQVAYFSTVGRPFEWKVHSFDAPTDLATRLQAQSFEPGDPEALMVYRVGESPSIRKDGSIRLERVTSAAGIGDVAAVQAKVWGEDLVWLEAWLRALMPRGAIFCAYDGTNPVGTGWMEFPEGVQFADIHGGAVLPQYRGQGIYSALFEIRAQEASRRGIEFLAVDAGPMSRPILLEKGFSYVCDTIPFRKRANKAPEPTPTSVTSPAIAR